MFTKRKLYYIIFRPGTYEHNVKRNRKVQFHGSFGGPQSLRTSIQTICLSDLEKKPVSPMHMFTEILILPPQS